MSEKLSDADLRLMLEFVKEDNWLAESEVENVGLDAVDTLDGNDVAGIIDELLELRSMRDASGEEVSDLRTVICSGIWSNTKQKQEAADVAVDSIVSKVFFLREQLREAREENNRYHDEAEVSDALVLSLQKEVKTLAAERDEVVGLLKWIFRSQYLRHCFEWAILSDESRRILEIVEGK